MKKRILQFLVTPMLLFCGIFLFNLTHVDAQVFEFVTACDFNSDLSITEADLLILEDYLESDTECSTSSEEVCICDIDDDRDCDKRDYRTCKYSLGASLAPVFRLNGGDYPGTQISIDSALTVNVASFYDITNYDLNSDGVINIAESSFFERFYRFYKRLYSQRKRLGTTTSEYLSLDVDGSGVVDSKDKKIVYSFRKYLKKAYGQKTITEAALRDLIAENVLDLNDDGAVNKLDYGMLKIPYKVIRGYIKGRTVTVHNINNFDFNNDEVVNEADYLFVRALKKRISKYKHIYNYSSAYVKADILEDYHDLNRDGLVNRTDKEIIKDFNKKQRKMKKYTPADEAEWNADFDLNSDGVIDSSDVLLLKRYYVKAKSHLRYGKTLLEYTDTTAPVITIDGESSVDIVQNDVYVDAGVLMAMDDVDGNLTSQVVTNHSIDTSIPGTYTVSYTVEDSSGNQGFATRTVIVIAVEPL